LRKGWGGNNHRATQQRGQAGVVEDAFHRFLSWIKFALSPSAANNGCGGQSLPGFRGKSGYFSVR
jgi:hypothetical protein